LSVAVIGGGISGLRAALTLARAGQSVTLFEKNRHLGGRVFSFPTAEFGEVDIGQHVWLRCCTALERLLADLGVPETWIYCQPRFALPYKRPGAPDFTLASAPLPGLLHLLPGLLRFPGLGLADKARLAWGMFRARLYRHATLEALDAVSFADWLRRQGQSPVAIRHLWEPIVLSVCNGRAPEISARHALFTFRESLLKSRHAPDICFLRRPLSAVFDRQARTALAGSGVEVASATAVQQVRPGPAVEVHLAGPGVRTFDRAILTVPAGRVQSLLPGATTLPAPANTGAIAGLLLKFARPVMDGLFFAALDSPVQMVFNKTAVWGEEKGGDGSQIVELVISGAAREVRLGAGRVAAELLPALGELLPRVRETPVLATRLLVHGAATFAVPPGGEARRLPTVPAQFPQVYLAGDGAATGWPSTMESAARAGESAARAVLNQASC
jgi:squalene-associated FAD-dependent desaturase